VDELKRTRDADQERRERLNQRLRQAFIEGAEEDSRRRLGRGLSREELERVLRRYPGDVVERGERQAPTVPRPKVGGRGAPSARELGDHRPGG